MKILSQTQESSIAAALILCAFVFAIPTSYAPEREEILRYEVT